MREVDSSNPWPDGEGGLVDLCGNRFRDKRGSILNLAEFQLGSVAIIKSKRNSIRSNHWHREDAHYLFTLEGHWFYQECDPEEKLDLAPRIEVHMGETVYTPMKRLHRCTFVENTTLVSMSKLTRTHDNHEADVVRVGG